MRRSQPWMIVVLLALPRAAALAGHWHASEGNSPGWYLMTLAERIEHQRRLRSFTRIGDCRAYLEAHHAQMAARARARVAGAELPARPSSACDQLERRGWFR